MKYLNSPKRIRSFINWMNISVGLVLLIELFNRRSFLGMFDFIVNNPMVVFYNACIVALSFSLVYFTKRQKYTFFLVYGIWISLAFVNMVIRTFRMTPLTLDDVQFISNISTIMPLYLSPIQIILVITISISLIIGLVIMYFKSNRQKRRFKYGFIHLGIIGGLVLSIPNFSTSVARFEETDGNLKTTYDEFGFVYSFVQSIISKGVKRPANFDEEQLIERLKRIDYDSSNAMDVNIIALQLESFFDVRRLPNITLESNPIPYFSALKQKYSSGLLGVPTVGGGTANSEFEFLTSMSLSYFGVGEYPYKTVLKGSSLPSLVSYFNGLNYSTTAIHNHVANFYRRHEVYKNLGFDHFVSLETMEGITTTPMGWAKDKHLIPYIQAAMNQSTGKDFIFAVSVQGHGEYPNTPLPSDMIEFVKPTNERSHNNLNYFLNQLHEMDAMIEELVAWIQLSDEPIMLLLYGDHLPGIEFGFDAIMSYQSDYVIVTNFETAIVSEDIRLPELGAKALSLISHPGTTIHQLHQSNINDKELTHWIHYDWVVGNKVSMDQIELPKQMYMGLSQPIISSIKFASEYVILEGKNFLPHHVIVYNNQVRKTTYISDSIILFEGIDDGEYKIDFAIASDNNEVILIKQ